jgi:hypothetical protein
MWPAADSSPGRTSTRIEGRFRAVRLSLYDLDRGRLVSFAEARKSEPRVGAVQPEWS